MVAQAQKRIGLEERPGAGRPKNLSRVSKITTAKSLGKRRQSTRSLAHRITPMGKPVSKDTFHGHLTGQIKAKEKEFVQNMLRVVFMQDDAPAHTAIRKQKWCSENFNSLWGK